MSGEKVVSLPSGKEYSVWEVEGPTQDGWPKRLSINYEGMKLSLVVAKGGMCVLGGDKGEFSMGCVTAIAHALIQLGEEHRIEEMRFLWLLPKMEALIHRIAQRAVKMEPKISLDFSFPYTVIARRKEWEE